MRELAKSYFNLRTAPLNTLKTLLDKLDKVDRLFNQGSQFSDWKGIRVFELQFVQGNGVASQRESSRQADENNYDLISLPQ